MKMNKVLLTTAIVASISSCALASGSNIGYNNVSNGDYGFVFGSNNTTETTATSSLAFGDGNVVKQANSMAFGQGNVSDGENSFVGGDKAKAIGRDSFAFGSSAEALVDYTVAIGSQARTNAENTVAIGNGAYASGVSSMALGRTNVVTGDDSVVVGANNGTVSAGQSAILGYNNKILDSSKEQLIFGSNSQTKGQGAVAIGTHASATQIDALALGNNTVADVQNGVAIGTNSVTELAVGTTNIKDNASDIRFSNSTFAGSVPDSVVSFGTNGRAGAGGVTQYTRQLQNVSAGRVSSTSTDAINGSQLYDVALEAQKHNTVVSGDNVTVSSNDNNFGRKEYKISVNKDLVNMNSVHIGDVYDSQRNFIDKAGSHVFNGEVNTLYGADGIKMENTDNLDTAKVDLDGLVVDSNDRHIEFTTSNVNVDGQRIHGVAAGSEDTDAVNVSQLRNTINSSVGSALNQANQYTDNKVAKVGANSAALSALHPLQFNPNEKVEYSVGYGNYKGSNAVAVGVFAHPNENILLSLGATFGTGDNMINAGATFRVGKSYKQVTNSNVAVAKEVQDLNKKLAELTQKYDNLVKSLNHSNGTDYDVMFPDVPKGHWAYDFVKDLSDKGYLVGYPDGTFKGDKPMTRYEFATAVYRALQNGALIDANMVKAIKEFKPELKDVEDAQRFVIKRESGSDNEIHKVERVNVNTKSIDGMYRDVYGTNLKA